MTTCSTWLVVTVVFRVEVGEADRLSPKIHPFLLLLYHFIHTLYIYITKVYRYSVLVNIYSISKKFTHTYSSPSRFKRVNK